jgi:PAS domain-containing protein
VAEVDSPAERAFLSMAYEGSPPDNPGVVAAPQPNRDGVDPGLRAIVEHLPAPVIVVAVDGRITYVNRAAVDAAGQSASWLAGRRLLDFVHPRRPSVGAATPAVDLLASRPARLQHLRTI